MRQGPSRKEVEQAALRLLARHGGQVLATARRFAASPEDAEDAYQRSLEILLTKAPTTREEELLPWLRTVVKHEAFALRRQRERLTPVSGDGEPPERASAPSATHEQAERYERLGQSAEALRRLKPQEIRCLVLKARGLSYREICETTGFTYTKVNRCLTEGRQALAKQLAGIDAGAECDRLAPLLSALADREATADQIALLRPHMKTCLACRARLREFRAAPARVAALTPAAALATQPDSWFQTLLHAAHHKAGAMAERAHTAAELVTGQKVAALAATAAAVAGGGTAVDQLANHHGPPVPPPAAEAPRSSPTPESSTTTTAPPPSSLPLTSERQATTEAAAPAAPPAHSPPPPDPAREFAPAPELGPRGTNAGPSASAAASAETAAAEGRPQAATGGSSAPGSSSGEFAP